MDIRWISTLGVISFIFANVQGTSHTAVPAPLSANITTTNETPAVAATSPVLGPVSSPEATPNTTSTTISGVQPQRTPTADAVRMPRNMSAVEHHLYYNSIRVNDELLTKRLWIDMANKGVLLTSNLSQSYRIARTVQLSFDFPFYGYPLRNVTVTTGGFIYVGDVIHTSLAATQYVAPLMANFDTTISDHSYVKYFDNGTAFTVEWGNVHLHDNSDVGGFSFQATLRSSGDIVFVYNTLPLPVESISDVHHPVKVGVADAYINDRNSFFGSRKSITEYHRLLFKHKLIQNGTVIILIAQPTCISMQDCFSCTMSVTNFQCRWCEGRCSDGLDRRRQEWRQAACHQPGRGFTDIDQCLAQLMPWGEEGTDELRGTDAAPATMPANVTVAEVTPEAGATTTAFSNGTEAAETPTATTTLSASPPAVHPTQTPAEASVGHCANVSAVEYHLYYNSTMVNDELCAQHFWMELDDQKGVVINSNLSHTNWTYHTVLLSFDFPYYGYPLRNVTVTARGFIYVGDSGRVWMDATQYIAPLMANFDPSISEHAYIKYLDNGTAFTVQWGNLRLQDRPDVGGFSFQATLLSSGDIVFVYHAIPLPVESISEEDHTVKVGISDAYVIQRVVFFVTRKTIYEYQRVSFKREDIKNGTVIFLNPLPSCSSARDCVSCTSSISNFECRWCEGRCSDGMDRRRQEWQQGSCDQQGVAHADQCPEAPSQQPAGEATGELSAAVVAELHTTGGELLRSAAKERKQQNP